MMTPADEVLQQAKLVRAQLLIPTHTPEITHSIQDTYLINLEIHIAELVKNTLFVQLELEDLYTECSITTFGTLTPTDNIIEDLDK